jgi:hypothetical protein
VTFDPLDPPWSQHFENQDGLAAIGAEIRDAGVVTTTSVLYYLVRIINTKAQLLKKNLHTSEGPRPPCRISGILLCISGQRKAYPAFWITSADLSNVNEEVKMSAKLSDILTCS